MLDFSRKSLKFIDFEELARAQRLINVISLDLSNNQITKLPPNFGEKLPNLKSLYL